jgi:ParB family chromosome partitioning protein
MKIALAQIHPSPNPIRKTWDEEKMKELMWSLMEEGQVEPIGVRTNGAGYIVVWGHRRVEAARRANWKEIEASIVPNNEIDNLIQAGIENLASEDMPRNDKEDWAYRLNVEFGLTVREISRRSTLPEQTIYAWLLNREERIAGLDLHRDARPREDDEGTYVIREIRQALGKDIEGKKAILDKVSHEELTGKQTREVAHAYRDAPTPAVKAAILKAPIISRDTAADILRRSINRVELETGAKSVKETNDWQKEREERRTYQNYDLAVKEHIDAIRLFLESVKKGVGLIKFGKYSPEAAKFVIRKHNSLIEELKSYNDLLETVK